MSEDYVPIKRSTLKKMMWCLDVLRRMIGYPRSPYFKYVDDVWDELIEETGDGQTVVMTTQDWHGEGLAD